MCIFCQNFKRKLNRLHCHNDFIYFRQAILQLTKEKERIFQFLNVRSQTDLIIKLVKIDFLLMIAWNTKLYTKSQTEIDKRRNIRAIIDLTKLLHCEWEICMCSVRCAWKIRFSLSTENDHEHLKCVMVTHSAQIQINNLVLYITENERERETKQINLQILSTIWTHKYYSMSL